MKTGFSHQMASHRPVCIKCETELRPLKNGVLVVDYTEDGEPYQLWHADSYRCPGCGAEIVAGFGFKALAESWDQPWFERIMADEPLIPNRPIAIKIVSR